MPSIKHLMHNTPLLLLSIQVSSFVIPWMIVLWLSHMQSAEQVGRFSFILAILAPLTLLLASPSRNFLLTQSNRLFENAATLRVYLSIAGLVLAFGIGFWLQQWQFVIVIYLFKVTEQLFDLPIANAIENKRVDRLFSLSWLKWACILACVGLAFMSQNINLTLVLLSVLFVISSLSKHVSLNFKTPIRRLISLLQKSLPLSLSALAFSVYFNVPRYILGQQLENVMLSVFTIASFLVMAALVILNSFMQSRLPQLKQALFTSKTQFKAQLTYCIGLLLIIFLLLQLTHIEFFSNYFWLAHNNIQLSLSHDNYVYRLVILFSWAPLLFSVSNYLYIVSGKHKLLLSVTCINIFLSYVFGLWLFEQWSFNGLMWMISVSSLVQFLGGLVSLKNPKELG